MNSHSWRDDAACREADPDLFFPPQWSLAAAESALEYCRRCPVTEQCLNEALDNNDEDAIRGNTTAGQRRKLRRRLAAKKNHPATPALPEFRTVP